MKKKNGFTLIELLAVIIILGVLMVIAVPAVTKYINDSRKSGYVSTAKNIAGGVRNLIHSGALDLDDPDTTYYIDTGCIKTDNGSNKSPYGDFTKAYVVVTAEYDGYEYFWTSVDSTGIGVKSIINVDKLDTENIEEGVTSGDITTTRGLDNRSKVVVVNSDCQKGSPTERTGPKINSTTGGELNSVKYPIGKTKETVVTGDLVRIGTQEFYVVKHDGSDLVLLSHYNLNVGSNKKAGATEGIQDSEVKGWVSSGTKYGNIAFSSTNYWKGKVGTDYPGSFCSSNTYTSGTNCVYVYDSNSNLKTYVDAYKTYLEEKGATIKSARLLRVEEAFELGCGNGAWNCSNAPAFVKETSYWLGSARSYINVWYVYNDVFYSIDYGSYNDFGVRPVIVI